MCLNGLAAEGLATHGDGTGTLCLLASISVLCFLYQTNIIKIRSSRDLLFLSFISLLGLKPKFPLIFTCSCHSGKVLTGFISGTVHDLPICEAALAAARKACHTSRDQLISLLRIRGHRGRKRNKRMPSQREADLPPSRNTR